MKRLAALMLLALGACSPTAPEAPPSPPSIIQTCNVSGTGNTCNVGTGNGSTPSPSPGTSTGPFLRPDYVKITQFGENCPTGIEPSGIDRSVRIGCTKALTLSPKCRQVNGPDIDCPVPQGAAPDDFSVVAGADHIDFSASQSSAFNRDARGKTAGSSTITGSYGGVRAQDDFVLTVIQ